MGNIVNYIDIAASGPLIDEDDLWPVYRPKPDPLFTAHWVFGIGGGSRRDLYSEQEATIQATAPTYAAHSVAITGRGNALLTPFDDVDELTFAMVVQRPSANAILAGTFTATASDGGWAIWGLAGDANARMAIRRAGGTSTIDSVPWGCDPGEFAFVANGHRGSGTRRLRGYVGGQTPVEATPSGDKIIPARKSAIGASVYPTTTFNNGAIVVAEAMYVASYLAEADLDAAYARAQERMAAIGITI